MERAKLYLPDRPCRNAKVTVDLGPNTTARARNAARTRQTDAGLKRLQAALATVAELVLIDRVYAPIFRRLEEEIVIENAVRSDDITERARAVIRQKDIGASRSRT